MVLLSNVNSCQWRKNGGNFLFSKRQRAVRRDLSSRWEKRLQQNLPSFFPSFFSLFPPFPLSLTSSDQTDWSHTLIQMPQLRKFVENHFKRLNSVFHLEIILVGNYSRLSITNQMQKKTAALLLPPLFTLFLPKTTLPLTTERWHTISSHVRHVKAFAPYLFS